MKKVDYYATNQPWKMPKWLGATIGGVFGLIAVASVVLIVQLTKSPEAPKPVVAAAAAVAAPVAHEEAAPAIKSTDEVKITAPAHAERMVASHSRHGKKHDKHAGKAMRVASAKRPSGLSDGKAQAILANHKTSRKDKDALDKLLGL